MRGVAALVVAYLHYGYMTHTYAPRFGGLAVDLFFMLSGFVLFKAYDKRLSAGLAAIEFMKIRLRRLYPLYFMGFALGVLALVLVPAEEGLGPKSAFASGALNLLGLPTWLHSRFNAVFPVDPPFWSLFFEFWIANGALALFHRRLSNTVLLGICAVCGVCLVGSEVIFHSLDLGSRTVTFLPAFARVGFGFFLGYGIGRLHTAKPPKLHVPSALCVAAMAACLFLPLSGGLAQMVEPCIVFFAFPACIYWGAEAVERRPEVGTYLGNCSYALYAIHYPMFAIWTRKLAAWPPLSSWWMHLAIVAFAALVALAADRWPDRHARRWLNLRSRPT